MRNWILGLACLFGLATGAAATTQSLVILHDNDIHGHLRSFCYIEVAKGPAELCDVGGAARRATLVHRMRAGSRVPVLLIDAGDTSTRGPLATEYEGQDEVAAMNALGYAMAAIGNNEFKLKDAADANDAVGAQAAMARLVRQSHFPWLCANATDAKGNPLPGVKPFIVRRVGRLRIAFLGLTTGRSATYPQAKGLVIIDPVAAAKTWIPKARANADVLIAVTHLGVDDDHRLVRETSGIDAVVGGDSHTFLYQPAVEKNLDGAAVPIVQDGEFGVNLGRFELTFEGGAHAGWHLAHYADRLMPVDSFIAPDRRVAALVEHYAHPLDVKVGMLAEVGATPADRARLTAELLARAFQQAAQVDVGVQPDAILFNSFRNQDVTRFQIRAVLPFHDTVWRGEATGQQLKDFLLKPPPAIGTVRATIAVSDIDPARTYSIAATAFLGRVIAPKGTDTDKDVREAVESYLKAAQR